MRRPRQHRAADDDDVVVVLVLRAPRRSARRRARGTTGRGCRSCGSACRRRGATGRSRGRLPRCWSSRAAIRSPRRSRISSSSPFSTIGLRPSLRLATLSGLTSTPTTVWPSAANDAADTLPTYPRPNTETFIVLSLVLLVCIVSRPVGPHPHSHSPGDSASLAAAGAVDSPAARPRQRILEVLRDRPTSRSVPRRAAAPRSRCAGAPRRRESSATTACAKARGSSAMTMSLSVSHRQAFGADGRRDDGLAHRHRLEDLEPRAAADAQRHDVDRARGDVRPDVVHAAGDLDARRRPRAA